MKKHIALSILISLAACVSHKEIDKGRKDAARFEDSLEVGISKNDLKKRGTDPTNCTGSPSGVERCEATFWTNTDSAIIQSSYTKNEYTGYGLYFENGKLKRWAREVSTKYQGPDPTMQSVMPPQTPRR